MPNYYAPQVRRLQEQGLSPKEIASFLKIRRQTVYQIQYRDRLKETTTPYVPAKPKSLWERLKWWAK